MKWNPARWLRKPSAAQKAASKIEWDVDHVIRRYLALLDTQTVADPELCADLMRLYEASRRRPLAVSFATLCAHECPEARKYLTRLNQQGGIRPPEPKPPPDAAIAGGSGTVCVAANALYFPALINLIGSLHRNSLASLDRIVVGDLGMDGDQIEYLKRLARVEVVPIETSLAFQEWKFPFVLETLRSCQGPLLYLDAGCYVEKDLSPWFGRIREQGHLMFFNGPYDDPIHLTRNWTARAVYDYFGLDKAADESVTAISTLFGIAPEQRELLEQLVRVNVPALLRPHPDCIDNRYDQSLFSVWAQGVAKLPLLRFEDELTNSRGYGASDPTVTIHRSRSRPGEAYEFLRARAITS